MMELVEKGFPNFEHRMAAENRHEQLSPMDFPKAKSNFACSSYSVFLENDEAFMAAWQLVDAPLDTPIPFIFRCVRNRGN